MSLFRNDPLVTYLGKIVGPNVADASVATHIINLARLIKDA